MKLKCKYLLNIYIKNVCKYKILIFWDTGFLTFMSCKLYSSKLKQRNFEMFYFTCNESRIYESFTF